MVDWWFKNKCVWRASDGAPTQVFAVRKDIPGATSSYLFKTIAMQLCFSWDLSFMQKTNAAKYD